ncbi:SLOG family protein [Intestinimonas butyriciproducens]|uniref:SLOG family protein n=1 Tax=Intestinimonas butyriciproducens TaxID=1297617 RepID=UPI00195EA4A2|nr:SLOG family protein [Intestinimonas butyriciproducens]MBM6977381.1 DUF1273 family protein [Intestinimonas butyriciproducens]
MRERTCCFTGHRDIPADRLQMVMTGTEAKVRELILRGYRYFGVGGAVGYDTIVAEMLFRLREREYPGIRIILVYPFDGFISRWSDSQQATYARLLPLYNKRVCVCKSASREAYLTRDRHLVDCSSVCVAYCTRQTGGTAYTIRYAVARGVPVFNVGGILHRT